MPASQTISADCKRRFRRIAVRVPTAAFIGFAGRNPGATYEGSIAP